MSNRVLMLIVAMVGFAGLVFADSAPPSQALTEGGKVAERVMALDISADPSGDSTPALTSTTLVAPPANDTCAGAIPLTLNRSTVATTVGANDDYQTPATAACYSGIGNQATKAQGRDVAFSFTAPAKGWYTFGFITFSPNDPAGGASQNAVLYLTDDCTNPGTVSCIRGVNRGNPARGFVAGASNGFSQNNAEAIDCVPMTAGQTHFLIYDDRATGKCSPLDPPGGRASNCYQDSDCMTPGAVCNPVVNAGSRIMVEVRACNSEVEPNDTPATANPYTCGVIGQTTTGPALHCYLGTRAGQVCRRLSQSGSPFLNQDHPDSVMLCSVTGGRCSVDLTSGVGSCPGGPTDLCQAQVGGDCDPRCDVGPNAGKTCSTQAFCNPVSDQGATCVGACQIESTCVDNATGANTGVACTSVCVGSAIPAVNGRFCSALSGCPGGGTCTVTPNPPTPGATCVAGQTCTRVYNEGDTDFFSLGVVPAGSAIFAEVNSTAANDGDYRLRVTTNTQTLQFDDDDGFTRDNQSSPTIAGALANGQPTYLQVSKTQFVESGSYEVFANVRPPLAQAQLEDESAAVGNDHYFYWPGDILSISPIDNPIDNGAYNGYIKGTFAYNQDTDCWKFLVNEGDMMDWFGAANPQRTAGAVTLIDFPEALVYDAIPAGVSNFGWGGNPAKNTNPNVIQPGLKATSPAVTSTHLQWRAQYTGMLEVCMFAARQFISQGVPNYPNNWSGSLTNNCGPVQAAGPGTTTTDVSVVKTGPAGPVTSGDFFEYTITVKNEGNEIAQEVSLDETLDSNLTFISLSVDDGFTGGVRNLEGVVYPGNNTVCFSLPTPGYNDAPISCINASMAPGTTTTYVLTVQVNNCMTSDTVIDNTVTLTQVSTDPNPANDSSTFSITTVAAANNGCTDIVCDGYTCIRNLCTENDTCQGGVCVPGSDPNCDDNNVCTDDSCDAATGCINDSSQSNDACDDLNPCTINSCDPIVFCVFTPEPPTTPCYDGNPCTFEDYCDGNGSCGGVSRCDDGNACTDDFTESGSCVCTHAPTASGSPCSDGNACTGTAGGPDACDGAGVCAGGQPLPDGTTCDDGDPGTTGDVCAGGVCAGGASCDTQPRPKPEGYYKKLCNGGHGHPHAGDALTDADAVCVGQLTDTFAGIATVDDICAEWDHDTNGTHHDTNGPLGQECEDKAERELMALALNICRGRVCLTQEVDSSCGSDPDDHTLTTVHASLDTVDDILSDPARNKAVCKTGTCLAREINNGKALHHTSLTLGKEPGPGNKVRLSWDSPVMDDGSGEASSYTVWRRPLNADAPFVKLSETPNLTYVDATAGTGSYEYEVTFTIEP